MGMNTNNLGKDSSGEWSPMGAATDSAGNPATPIVDPDRPSQPETWYTEVTDSSTADAEAMVMGDVSMFNRFTLGLTALTATSATVSASIDGTTFTDIIMWDASTGAPFATAAITAVGTYYMDAKYYSYKITQNGAGGSTIVYSLSVK